jgi:hypothetical protein
MVNDLLAMGTKGSVQCPGRADVCGEGQKKRLLGSRDSTVETLCSLLTVFRTAASCAPAMPCEALRSFMRNPPRRSQPLENERVRIERL